MGFTFDPLVFSGLVPSSAAGGDVHWKGPVANAAALPLTGNSPGDIRVTLDTGNIWEWNGTAWFLPAIPYNEKGQPNGVATLDSVGHVPLSQLPASVVEYKGTWDASTNTPPLSDGTGVSGYFYIVSVGGTQDLGSGPITFFAGDWVLYNGTVWERADNFTGYANATLSNLANPTAVNQDLNMGTHAIKGMADPTLAQDAATKNYVDTKDALKANVTLNNLTSVSINQHTFEFDASAGVVNIQTAVNPGGSNTIQMVSGNASGGVSGDVNLQTGSAGGATSGSINLHTFNSASNNSGNVNISTGNAGTTSGNINLTAGAGSFSTGKISLSGSSVDVNNTKIHNVTDPTAAQDAATKNYVDTAGAGYANRTLSNLQSPVAVNQDLNPVTDTDWALGTAALRWVSAFVANLATDYITDSSGNPGGNVTVDATLSLNSHPITNVTNPSNPQDAATKNYVDTLDAANFQKDGSRAATGAFDLNSHQIHNVTNPTSAQDAATKNYVDTHTPTGTANTIPFFNNSGAFTENPAQLKFTTSNSGLIHAQSLGNTPVASGSGAMVSGLIGGGGARLEATGDGAHAFGYANDGVILATGAGAFAAGNGFAGDGTPGLTASGDGSIVLGYGVDGGTLTGSNNASFAQGIALNPGSTIVSSASGSMAQGYAVSNGDIVASGNGSMASGMATSNGGLISAIASGAEARGIAQSAGTINANDIGASARGSVDNSGSINALNPGSSASGFASSNGQVSASGSGAHASGFGGSNGGGVFAQADGAHAFGYGNDGQVVASGIGSLAAGVGYAGPSATPAITASGFGSQVFGYSDSGAAITSSNHGASAQGYASGSGSTIVASGQASIASGFSSGGDDVVASGQASFSHGTGLQNNSLLSVYMGRYAVNSPNTPTTWTSTDPLFVLGNGASAGSRHNAFQVDKDGTVHFVDPSGSGSVSVKAPTGLTSWTMTLPPDDGTNGYVLTTDGAGVTTWQSTGGGGANQSLSNLTSPTAINQDLIFDEGTLARVQTKDNPAANTQDMVVNSGIAGTGFDSGTASLQSGAGDATGSVIISSGAASVGASGVVIVSSGSAAGASPSGDVSLATGSTAANTSGNIAITTGNAVGGQSGYLTFGTGQTDTTASGDVNIYTGSPGTANINSGNMNLSIGSTTGTGVRGQIRMIDGTEGVAGYVWTSTDTTGSGSWQANVPGSGANTALSNLASTAVNADIIPDTHETRKLGSQTGPLAWQQVITKQLLSAGDSLDIFSGSSDAGASATGLGVGIGADGNGLQVDVNGGGVTIATQTTSGVGISGDVTIKTGNSDNQKPGTIFIEAGNATTYFQGGDVTIASGSATQTSGQIFIGTAQAPNASGGITLQTATPTSNGQSGAIELITGVGQTSDSGTILFETGDTIGGGSAGDIHMILGNGNTQPGFLRIEDGSAVTGYVFTTTDNSGHGRWMAPAAPVSPKIKYGDTSGQAVNNTFPTITFANLFYDASTLYNTGTGVFTAPADGFYLLNCSLSTATTNFAANDYFGMHVVQTGAFSNTDVLNFAGPAPSGATGQTLSCNGSTVLQMATGDTAYIQAYCSTATTLLTLAGYNYLCITKISS